MSGKARDKVVTSGRLTGKVKGSRAPPDPGPPPWPQPDYSLYSTDSEDKVTSLHRGLDQCAALLSGILQADEAGLQKTSKRVTTKPRPSTFQGKKTLKKLPTKPASPGLSRTMKGGVAKSRASTSQGKMVARKVPTKVGDLHSSERHQPASLAAAAQKFSPPPAHTGVKLHPPQKPTLPLQSPSLSASHQTFHNLSTTVPPSQRSNSVLLHNQNHSRSASEAPRTSCRAACDGKDESVPMRDTDHEQSCTLKEPCVQLEPGPDSWSREESCCMGGTRVETVKNLLEELRALIAGQGNVAERLLSRLEQTLGGSDVQTAAVGQNPQLCRCVKNQHEKEEEPQKQEILLYSEEPSLQKELVIAQFRLQELQNDLTELRKALQDTQSQLRDTEAEKALMKTELVAARNRLLESEREKSELASVAQQQLKEMENLRRRQRHHPSDYQDTECSLSLTRQYFGLRDPAVASTDCIKAYLMSLSQVEPTHTETVRVTAERDKNTSERRDDGSSHYPIRPEQGDKPAETLTRHQDHHPNQSSSRDVLPCGRQLLNSTSHCDVESVSSSWSMKSESTLNTRDEAAFRDGLAALDASIASLQKTIQLDLKK
ncbi:uncharacterized protein ccdc14 isoform X2 [Girardinichthys multiradiatus]|uniref:uncharacterized protein ccdc14 isoform X2 n=1 Tax=Girardinichthys multiradiatus TaxID=208333 RepID=UPI001FAB6432|nr:uncharacterized protein ccdc14 isoform X2 [Girardinichthys multiradiatus]